MSEEAPIFLDLDLRSLLLLWEIGHEEEATAGRLLYRIATYSRRTLVLDGRLALRVLEQLVQDGYATRRAASTKQTPLYGLTPLGQEVGQGARRAVVALLWPRTQDRA